MNTKALRQKILDLAIHGKLVPQDPNDEPASMLLERIRAEKERLIKEGKIKRPKKSKTTSDKPHYPYELPKGWVWTTLGEITNYGDSVNVQVDDIDNTDWVLELEDIEKDSANIIQHLTKNDRKINGTRHKFQKGEILYSKLRTYLLHIKVEHVKVGYLDLYSKGGKIRRLYIPKNLRTEAIKWLEDKNVSSGYIFLNRFGNRITTRGIAHQLKHFAEKYGMNRDVVYPHSFRHRFAKNFLERFNDIALLADLMGHERLETTRIYLRRTASEQQKIVDKVVVW